MKAPLFFLTLLSAALASPAFSQAPQGEDTGPSQPPSATPAMDNDRANDAMVKKFHEDVDKFGQSTNNLMQCFAHECYVKAKKEVADSGGKITDPQQTKTYKSEKSCVAHFKDLAEKFSDFDDSAAKSKDNPSLLDQEPYRKDILDKVTAFNMTVDNLASKFKYAMEARSKARKIKAGSLSISGDACAPDSDLPDLMSSVKCKSCSDQQQ